MNELSKGIGSLYQAADYGSLLKKLAGIREPVDVFFDQVMVLVENEAVKKNRLAILMRLHSLLREVADISMLQLS